MVIAVDIGQGFHFVQFTTVPVLVFMLVIIFAHFRSVSLQFISAFLEAQPLTTMAEQGCKLFVYGVDENLPNGELQVG